MSHADIALELWTREPASRPDRVRIRARIAGMHCSLCTGTIEKALRRHAGVEKVSVSLTHEQALVEYDPSRVKAELQAYPTHGVSIGTGGFERSFSAARNSAFPVPSSAFK